MSKKQQPAPPVPVWECKECDAEYPLELRPYRCKCGAYGTEFRIIRRTNDDDEKKAD